MKYMKIVILGESNVGKSSLLSQYLFRDVTSRHESTVGVDFKTNIVERDGEQIKLQLWDTAGQERFRTIVQMYYHNTDGVILVYDVTSTKSFEQLKFWMQEIDRHSNIDHSNIWLVANKTDLTNFRQVTRDEGLNLAEYYSITNFIELSARSHEQVTSLFSDIVHTITPKLPKTPAVNLKTYSKTTKRRCCGLF